MPGEIAGATCHRPSEGLFLEVLYRIGTGVFRGLDRMAEDDLAVVADRDIAALVQLASKTLPHRSHRAIGPSDSALRR
jgi:hypothetical protein